MNCVRVNLILNLFIADHSSCKINYNNENVLEWKIMVCISATLKGYLGMGAVL